jgi:hypothetical protein
MAGPLYGLDTLDGMDVAASVATVLASGEISATPRTTFETVDLETPASAATSKMVGGLRGSGTVGGGEGGLRPSEEWLTVTSHASAGLAPGADDRCRGKPALWAGSGLAIASSRLRLSSWLERRHVRTGRL